jgi:hypothetical protein
MSYAALAACRLGLGAKFVSHKVGAGSASSSWMRVMLQTHLPELSWSVVACHERVRMQADIACLFCPATGTSTALHNHSLLLTCRVRMLLAAVHGAIRTGA